jgi:hypothetical protein
MAKAKKPKQVPDSHPLAIHCARHGVTPFCLICRHLGEGSGLGYFAIKPEADEPAQAWCEACDRVLEAERGWSDRADAAADWKVYCTSCYKEALARHQLRSWLRGTSPEDFTASKPVTGRKERHARRQR